MSPIPAASVHRRWASAAVLVALFALALAPPVAEAQIAASGDPTGETTQYTPDEVSKLYIKLQKKFMSPYCPGFQLRDCTSEGGKQLRVQVRSWLEKGYTEAAITDYMVSVYGEEVLAAPPFRGSAIVVWVAPGVALLVGFFLLMKFLRSQTRAAAKQAQLAAATPASAANVDAALDEALEARLERDVQTRYQ